VSGRDGGGSVHVSAVGPGPSVGVTTGEGPDAPRPVRSRTDNDIPARVPFMPTSGSCLADVRPAISWFARFARSCRHPACASRMSGLRFHGPLASLAHCGSLRCHVERWRDGSSPDYCWTTGSSPGEFCSPHDTVPAPWASVAPGAPRPGGVQGARRVRGADRGAAVSQGRTCSEVGDAGQGVTASVP